MSGKLLNLDGYRPRQSVMPYRPQLKQNELIYPSIGLAWGGLNLNNWVIMLILLYGIEVYCKFYSGRPTQTYVGLETITF